MVGKAQLVHNPATCERFLKLSTRHFTSPVSMNNLHTITQNSISKTEKLIEQAVEFISCFAVVLEINKELGMPAQKGGVVQFAAEASRMRATGVHLDRVQQ